MVSKTLYFNDLKAALKNNELSHLYCFCGNDESQKDEAVTLLASTLWKKEKKDDYKIFSYFAEDGIEQALAAISQASLFDDTALYIIKHCHEVSATNKIHTMITDCINHLPQQSYVIFDTQENKPPSMIPSPLYTSIPVIQFYKPFEENSRSYILKKCKSLSLNITHDAVEMLLELTANNIKEIDDIITTISFADTKDITKEFLEGFIINEREAIEFEFVDLFFLKDKRAWGVLSHAIERNVNQILLVSLLFNHALKLEEFHLKMAQGASFDTLMKELKVFGKRQKVFAKQADIFSLESIRKLIAMLYTYDIKLKSYRPEGFFQANPLQELLLNVLA